MHVTCVLGSRNECDRYAVAVLNYKDGVVVGHLAKAVSTNLFIVPTST